MSLSQEVVDQVVSYCESLGVDKITLEGKTFKVWQGPVNTPLKSFINESLKQKTLSAYNHILWNYFEKQKEDYNIFKTEITQSLIATFREEEEEVVQKIEETEILTKAIIEGSEIVKSSWMDMTPLIDTGDNFYEFVLLDQRRNLVVSNFNRDTWLNLVGIKKTELALSALHVKFEFNIKEPRPMYVVGGDTYVNLYQYPTYMKNPVTPDYPEIFKKLIEHLFQKDERVIRFVHNWLRNMLVGRNQTLLALSGDKGIGKGVFSNLCRSLCGWRNTTQLTEATLRKEFNSAMKNKRLCIFDEVLITEDAIKEKVKLFMNNYIPIEAKGQEQEEVENFSSFIISMNNLTGLQIDPSDRRYSVPEITETVLQEVFTKEDFEKMEEIFKVSQGGGYSKEIESFGCWLIQNGAWEEFGEHIPWKEKHFMEIVEGSMTSWQQVIVDCVTSMEKTHYPLKDLKKELSTVYDSEHFAGDMKIKNFLRSYKIQNKYKLGSYRKIKVLDKSNPKSGNGRFTMAVIPSDKFMPKKDLGFIYFDDILSGKVVEADYVKNEEPQLCVDSSSPTGGFFGEQEVKSTDLL